MLTFTPPSPLFTSRGQQEAPGVNKLPEYDPKCYLCPGNPRAGGEVNPKYNETFVFVNDYSAVKEDQEDYKPEPSSDGKRSQQGPRTMPPRPASPHS